MKKNEGITLVALIITIVVMLILVAVSVNVIIKSNLIGTAEKAGDKYRTASEEEKSGVIEIDGKKYNSIEDYMAGKEKLPDIKAGERATENSNYNGAVIPEGFTVSKAEGETTIDEGLVIYLINDKTDEEIKNLTWSGDELENLKNTYDQFVWIPISHEQINNMFICQAKDGTNGNCNITVENEVAKCTVHNSTQMAGRLYATTDGENYKKSYTEVYTANTGRREPDVVTGIDTGDGRSTYLGHMKAVTGDNTSYETREKFKDTLQNEYNEIVALIYNAGGYYVGRYETSNITKTKGTAIKVVAGTKSGIASIDWYYMYAQQKAYVINKGLENKVKSSMMLGTCHDQMLEFVNVAGKYDVTTAENVGQGFSSNYNTGSQSTDMSKNIYDLEGNVNECTTEAEGGRQQLSDIELSGAGSYQFSNSASCRACVNSKGSGVTGRFQSRTFCNAVRKTIKVWRFFLQTIDIYGNL